QNSTTLRSSGNERILLEAEEDYILFINDDTRPAQTTFVERHLSFAAKHPDCCILGKLEWAQETPNALLFGPWTKRLSFDVGYDGLTRGERLGFHKFCTANVLVPRKFLQGCLFDDRFPFAAYEDIELGYRLAQQGHRLMYNPDPCVYHVHRYNPVMVIDRQKKAGHSLAYMLYSHPDLKTQYSPKISNPLARIMMLWVKTPFFSCFSDDFQLFWQQLAVKYMAFWESERVYREQGNGKNAA
ncbi:MAG: glycosyltransferase family 2 protein, partial [bacterium]|nr:glycosyltransferase family 2 protein [bacterium]